MSQFLYDVPDILYKYRDWYDVYHKRLLESQELYFASIDQFNDPFDGGIPHRYDPKQLTPENIFLKFYQITKREFPDWPDDKIHEECYRYQSRGHFQDEKYMEDFAKDTAKQINETFGIVSLSKIKDNFLMWSHYARSHTGYCIGFKKVELYSDTQCQFAHMHYETEIPLIDLFEDVHSYFKKLIGTKSKVWDYEDEYRLTKINSARKRIVLNPNTVAEIIFGCKMDMKERFKILSIAEAKYPHANIYEMKLAKNEFKIECIQIR